MKVYGLYVGCVHEGGDVSRVFKDKGECYAAAKEEAERYQKEWADNPYYKENTPEIVEIANGFEVLHDVFLVAEYEVE